MISKFDVTIQSDELTAADLYNAQAEWEAQQEAELSDFDPHRDFYAEMEDEYPQEPWDDDYSDYDPVDMYAAEWENYALRDWD